MAAALVQSVSAGPTAGSVSLVINGVVAGNALVVSFVQTGSTTRTYVLNGITGETLDVYTNPASAAGIFSVLNVAGGNYTLVVQSNTGTTPVSATAHEVSGLLTASALTDFGTYLDGVTSSSHACSDSDVAVVTGGFVVGSGTMGSAATSTVPGSGYTALVNAAQIISQYRIPASDISNDRGLWTSTGTDRVATAAMASYLPAAGGSIPVLTDRRR